MEFKNNMKMQKGFTIMELIVVVAIIAILASIIAVSVVQWASKSKDSAIKANLNTLQKNMTVWVQDLNANPSGNFDGFILSELYTAPANAISIINGLGSIVFKMSANKMDFCAHSPMVTDVGITWCVDSRGVSMVGTCGDEGVCEL